VSYRVFAGIIGQSRTEQLYAIKVARYLLIESFYQALLLQVPAAAGEEQQVATILTVVHYHGKFSVLRVMGASGVCKRSRCLGVGFARRCGGADEAGL
jgi:hypothetical protein